MFSLFSSIHSSAHCITIHNLAMNMKPTVKIFYILKTCVIKHCLKNVEYDIGGIP